MRYKVVGFDGCLKKEKNQKKETVFSSPFLLFVKVFSRFLRDVSKETFLGKVTRNFLQSQVSGLYYLSIGLCQTIEKIYRNKFGSINIFIKFA